MINIKYFALKIIKIIVISFAVFSGEVCAKETDTIALSESPARVAYGAMNEDEFISFLKNDSKKNQLHNNAWWVIIILVLLGGLAMNLTPCVLPLMPVTLIIIGTSYIRGLVYGLAIAVTYGLLGILASLGGIAFGSLQSNVWFNLFIALVFAFLSLSLFGIIHIDFSPMRSNLASKAKSKFSNIAFPFFMGSLSALLAGACVAPMLIAVLLLTADLVAKGKMIAIALPFIFGFGMALPWPFVGAGLQVLPKPGAWMKYVNKTFSFIIMGFALWYGFLAIRSFIPVDPQEETTNSKTFYATTETLNLSSYPKPLLVDCWASWCKNCTAMKHTTLSNKKVKEELKNWNVLHLQAESLKELKKIPQFKDIKGMPAFYIFED